MYLTVVYILIYLFILLQGRQVIWTWRGQIQKEADRAVSDAIRKDPAVRAAERLDVAATTTAQNAAARDGRPTPKAITTQAIKARVKFVAEHLAHGGAAFYEKPNVEVC